MSCPYVYARTAVGHYYTASGALETLVEHRNGHPWAVQPAPNPGGTNGTALYGVSCVSPDLCTAVGINDASHYGKYVMLVERYS